MREFEFQIILLKGCFGNFLDKRVRDLFTQIIKLKRLGYGPRYDGSVIPVDTTDFFATHILICEKRNHANILSCLKTVSLKECIDHYLGFPLLKISNESRAKEHMVVVEKMVQNYAKTPQDLFYLGGWTINPKVKKDKKLVNTIKDITKAMDNLCHNHFSDNPHVVGAAVKKYKAHEFFMKYGYRKMENAGERN